MRIENTFDVPASVDESWRLLNDVPAMVTCMPGAELVEVVGEDAWQAKLHVKLGPIALQFIADVTRVQVDEAGIARCSPSRHGRQRGAAARRRRSNLARTGGRRHARALVTELALRGAVAQYGRGVVADVAARLTAQFAECVAGKLRSTPELQQDPSPPAEPAPIGGLGLVFAALWRSLFRRGDGR